jgi:predicted TIM-barrel fold metal-dependent hydrolase
VQKAIDVHTHLSGRRDDALAPFAKRNRLRYTLDELLASMRANNVSKGLLLSPPLKGWTPLPNEEILKLCRRSGGMLFPVVTVEPTKKEVAAAVKFADQNRREVRAFKIRLGYHSAPASDSVFDRLYDYAEAEELPVLFHTGDTASSDGDLALSHPLSLDRLANVRPGLTIVLCHFGNPWFEDVGELLYKHEKVYADISGLTTGGGGYAEKFSRWLAQKVSEAIYFTGGAEKVFFGTDYPITKYSDALKLVDMLEVSEGDKERILWRNAQKVFRL